MHISLQKFWMHKFSRLLQKEAYTRAFLKYKLVIYTPILSLVKYNFLFGQRLHISYKSLYLIRIFYYINLFISNILCLCILVKCKLCIIFLVAPFSFNQLYSSLYHIIFVISSFMNILTEKPNIINCSGFSRNLFNQIKRIKIVF